MSAHPPFRLRLALAFLVIAVAGTVVGAALTLGSNQDAPTRVSAALIAPTGPPLGAVAALDRNPTAVETITPGMRLSVPDKAGAIRAEQARVAARAEAAAAEEQADILEYASAVAAAEDVEAAAAEEPPPPPPPPTTSTPPVVPPPPPPPDPGDGNGDSLYARLDNIATCESGRNPRAFNPQGPWYGAFQFRRDTWATYGGGAGDIRNYSYEEQREVAAALVRARGFAGSWPSCAARYGYT